MVPFMTPLVLDGSGAGSVDVAIVTDGLSHCFQFVKSAADGPTAGTLSLKLIWNDVNPRVTTAQTLAALETNLGGANDDLRFVSKLPGTEGNGIQVEYLNTGVGSQPLAVTVSGTIVTVRLGLSAGTKQIEGLTVVGTVTTAGQLDCVFTSALTGTINFTTPVELGDGPLVVGTKIRQRMELIAAITQNFDLSYGGDSDIVNATRKASAANDGTLVFSYANGTAAGMTNASSGNTTAGVAPAIQSTAAQVDAAIEAYAPAAALVTVTNKAANDGSGVVSAMAAANLTGGVNAVITPEYPESPFLDDTGAAISYDLAADNSGGFEFKSATKGRFIATVAGGTAGKTLYFALTTSK
jgi:hypothetical protein